MEHNAEKFSVRIEEGKYLFLNTVTHVASFTDGIVIICTTGGKIEIEGTDLKIEALDKTRGEAAVSGRIESVFLNEKKEEKSGMLARLFR